MKSAAVVIAGILIVLLFATGLSLPQEVQSADRVALLDVVAVDASGLPTVRYSAVFRFQILSAIRVTPAFERRLRGETLLGIELLMGADKDNVDGSDALTRLAEFLKAKSEPTPELWLEHRYHIGETRPLRVEVVSETELSAETWTFTNADGDSIAIRAPEYWGAASNSLLNLSGCPVTALADFSR